MAEIDFTDIERQVRKKREEEAARLRALELASSEESESADAPEQPEDAQDVPQGLEPVQDVTDEPENVQEVPDEPEDDSEHVEEEAKPERKLPTAPEEPDVDTMTASVEISPAGTNMTTDYKGEDAPDMEMPKRKPTVKSKSRRQRSEFVYLRDMPKSVVGEARRIFPTASNNTDAVTAYIAYKSGVKDGLTDTQLELLDTTEVADPIVEQNKRIAHVERTMTNMFNMLQELEMAVSYMIFDRLGFRRENPDAPRQANMNEPGMTEMIERVREMSRQMRQQENRRKGRPLR